MHAIGITSVHTMEGLAEFEALQKMAVEDKLDIRTRFYIPQNEGYKLVASNIRSGFGNANISIAGIKFFTDGSLGSQTAHMLEPYLEIGDKGISHISESELAEGILFFNQAGLSATVHAIGDHAIIKTLNAFEFVQKELKHGKLRNRIEHVQLVPQDQTQRIASMNLAASMQPVHIADDVEIGKRFWGERCAHAYPIAQLHKAGVNLAFGSDTPVADFNPFKGVYEAMERKYMLDPKQPSWHPQQAIGLKDALIAYTLGPAIACGDEKHSGSLEPGKYADFIVLDRDIFNLPSEQLLETKIIQTIMNGNIIFSRSS